MKAKLLAGESKLSTLLSLQRNLPATPTNADEFSIPFGEERWGCFQELAPPLIRRVSLRLEAQRLSSVLDVDQHRDYPAEDKNGEYKKH